LSLEEDQKLKSAIAEEYLNQGGSQTPLVVAVIVLLLGSQGQDIP